MANEFRNLQPNKYGKIVSDALRKGQETGNYLRGYGVGHLGDLFLGDAADVAEDMSYGRMPFTGSGMTTQIKPGAVDLAGYAGGAGAIGKGLVKGGMNQVGNMADSLRNMPSGPLLNKTPRWNTARQEANRSSSDLFNTRTDMLMDPSRREALKTMGKGAAVGTAAMTMPLALKAGAIALGKGAAPTMVKTGAKAGLALLDPKDGIIQGRMLLRDIADVGGWLPGHGNVPQSKALKDIEEAIPDELADSFTEAIHKMQTKWNIDVKDMDVENIADRSVFRIVPENSNLIVPRNSKDGRVLWDKWYEDGIDLVDEFEALPKKIREEISDKFTLTGKVPEKWRKLPITETRDFNRLQFKGSKAVDEAEKIVQGLFDTKWAHAYK